MGSGVTRAQWVALWALLCAFAAMHHGAACQSSAPKDHFVFGAYPRQPIIPSSWMQAAWFVDPAAGNDGNTCITSGSPCKTWQELVARWGTVSPRLRQNTTITFLSSHSDNSDPVYFRPFIENQAIVVLKGILTQVASGTLGSVTAKSWSTPQLLQADIGGAGASNQLLINSTHAAHAWVYKNVSGTVFSLSQPMAPISIPSLPMGVEVDTFANGDSFTLNAVPAINIVDVEPVVADLSTTGSGTSGVRGYLYLSQLDVLYPAGGNIADTVHVGAYVRSVDVMFHRLVDLSHDKTPVDGFFGGGLLNCNVQSSIYRDPSAIVNTVDGGIVSRGQVAPVSLGNVVLEGDVIFNGLLQAYFPGEGAGVGCAYIESGSTVVVQHALLEVNNFGGCGGTTALWGPGAINVRGQGHVAYLNGNATNTFLLTGGIKINNFTTACSHTSAAPDVVSCGIALTPGNLDATAGGGRLRGKRLLPWWRIDR